MQGTEIWRTSLDRPSHETGALYELLDYGERARAAKFRSEVHRDRFVVSRATLRMLLGEYTSTPAAEVQLRVLPGGKPALRSGQKGTPSVHFNLSHCGDLALFAFSECEIGIDVERVNSAEDVTRVAASFFAAEESRVLTGLEETDRAAYFYRTWVRKEAYLKASGAGFAVDPACLIVDESTPGAVRLLDQDGARRIDSRYAVYDLTGIDGHAAAIAVGSTAGSVPRSAQMTLSSVVTKNCVELMSAKTFSSGFTSARYSGSE